MCSRVGPDRDVVVELCSVVQSEPNLLCAEDVSIAGREARQRLLSPTIARTAPTQGVGVRW